MAKIMLVEDDVNLSEIYRARLEAEGYQVVSAGDGEEALALAVKEHPDLIICDVMMPKISGFEMLDILRGTPGIQNSKVIMMTALSQAEDKERAAALGADRYLVKSQVTLEDVVQTTKDVLASSPTGQATTPTASPAAATEPPKTDNISVASPPPLDVNTPTVPSPTPPVNVPIVSAPAAPIPTPVQIPVAAPTAASPPQAANTQPTITTIPVVDQSSDQTSASEAKAVNQQIENFVDKLPAAQATPEAQIPPQPAPASSVAAALDPMPTPTPAPQSTADHDGIDIPGKKVIQPLNDPAAKPDLDMLVAKEQQKELERANAQPLVAEANPAVESSGYLNASGTQPGQVNPNNSANSTDDPNNIAL